MVKGIKLLAARIPSYFYLQGRAACSLLARFERVSLPLRGLLQELDNLFGGVRDFWFWVLSYFIRHLNLLGLLGAFDQLNYVERPVSATES